ncbi:PEP-CTERM sorting domain-containing protein [Colwellia sp. MB02u-6]|uniref:PEP-CTERM sorting domain-containing protein n=1 Tax=Colwellia sp. MB02u-6 TaxID=2759824 RepID=UPI0015F5D5E9|nr:PEP-CTERM sorting domain-containing protein [Colwellia sp. MB02u-6]MBA6328245.1 PEP-CTERM sorting domain-containing protein [Colwellia sp. MB02u-6]
MSKPIKSLLILITLFLSNNSIASLITNGDFQDNLQQWYSSGNVSATDNRALLTTDIGYFQSNISILAQGDDGTFSFTNSILLTTDIKWLIFDAKIDIFDDLLESDLSSFSEILRINLYDELDFTGASDLLFSSGSDFLVTNNWQTYQLDISALVGRSIALSFELLDENNKKDSIFQLDNIAFSANAISTPVPEPSTFILFTIATIFLRNCKRNY